MVILGLFLNNEMRTGGNRRYLELMESLAERGNEVLLVMNARLEYEPAQFSRMDIDVKYRRKSFPPASWLFKKNVRAKFDELASRLAEMSARPVDWILIHGDLHFPCAEYLAKRLGARILFGSRCNDVARAGIMRKSGNLSAREKIASLLFEALNRKREKKIANASSVISFQNCADRDEFSARTGCGMEKTVIIPGNIGPPRFTDEWRDKNRSSRVSRLVYVGALSPSKGLPCLLDALALLKNRGHSSLRLSVLAKVTDADAARALLESRGIEDMVSLEGYALPFSYLAECDLLVYPSLYDAFPDAVLEALHAGCPVIASRVGGIPEMLERDELLFDSGDARAIADTVERCVLDPSYYAKLRELCGERAARYRFDWASEWEKAMQR